MESKLKLANALGTRLPIAIAIFLLSFAYPAYKFFAVQALFPEYQAFPLVICAILAILYFRLKDSIPVSKPVSGTRSVFVLFSVAVAAIVLSLCVLVALQIRSYRFAVIILSLFLALLVLVSKLHYQIAGIWYIWALTLLPLIRLNRTVVSNLQLWSSWLSSQILEVFGVLHVMRGNTLLLPDRELFVDEACSGIVSLVTIISAVSLYCVWMQRSLAHTFLMILLGGTWTVFMNTVRIVSIAICLQWWGVDLSEGLLHTLLGVMLFLISIGALKLVDLVLYELFRPIEVGVATGDRQQAAGYYLMSFWDRWFVNEGAQPWQKTELLYGAYGDNILRPSKPGSSSLVVSPSSIGDSQDVVSSRARISFVKDISFILSLPVLLIFLFSLGLQVYLIRFDSDSASQMALTRPNANQFTQSSGLISSSNYRLVKYDARVNDKRKDLWGEQSCVWVYEDVEGAQFVVSLDFPFGPEFHELSGCYRGAGWSVSDYKVRKSQSDVDPWVASSFKIRNGATTQTVFFTSFTPDGSPVQRSDIFSRVGITRGFLDVGSHYQVQMVTNDVSSQELREKGEALLIEAAKFIRDKICVGITPPKA